MITLVLGGTRSGKSAVAEALVARSGGPVLYVATAEAGDAEMSARIAAHRRRRPAEWVTLEAPLEPARAVREWLGAADTVLLDCLGLLVSNVLLAEGDAGDPAARLTRLGDELLGLVADHGARVIVVSSEVGAGLVPLSAIGRLYLDLLGDLNQRIARAADHAYLVVAGLAIDLKALAIDLGATDTR